MSIMSHQLLSRQCSYNGTSVSTAQPAFSPLTAATIIALVQTETDTFTDLPVLTDALARELAADLADTALIRGCIAAGYTDNDIVSLHQQIAAGLLMPTCVMLPDGTMQWSVTADTTFDQYLTGLRA